MRLVRNGSPIDPSRYTRKLRLGGGDFSDAIDPSKVAGLFDGGATVVTQSLHRTASPVRRFVDSLVDEVSHPVQANSYLTPPASQGLATHSDRHDVFVVQVNGSKVWEVDGFGETTLADGDVLYIPAGVEHSAQSTDESSLHLTIGIIRRTYRSVIERALRRERTRPRPTTAASSVGLGITGGSDPRTRRVGGGFTPWCRHRHTGRRTPRTGATPHRPSQHTERLAFRRRRVDRR